MYCIGNIFIENESIKYWVYYSIINFINKFFKSLDKMWHLGSDSTFTFNAQPCQLPVFEMV